MPCFKQTRVYMWWVCVWSVCYMCACMCGQCDFRLNHSLVTAIVDGFLKKTKEALDRGVFPEVNRLFFFIYLLTCLFIRLCIFVFVYLFIYFIIFVFLLLFLYLFVYLSKVLVVKLFFRLRTSCIHSKVEPVKAFREQMKFTKTHFEHYVKSFMCFAV